MKECLNCQQWRMRESGLMRYGLGRCAVGPLVFTQARHSCSAHIAAPPETVASRTAWLTRCGLVAPPPASTP
ncbi:hypothetical protein J2W33_001733 [Variovorax boronicumulans]|nr:hypothetical protein [Variovorax boronicumulans]